MGFNGDESPALQISGRLREGLDHNFLHLLWANILAPELHDAGALDAGEIEQRAVIQIMGKDDGLVGPGPGDDFRIKRFGRPNRTPVCDLMSRLSETTFPRRGKVHIQQNLQPRVRARSCSSARQAA